MLKKIKLLFIFLAVTAVVSVFSFFDILGGVQSALLHDAIQPLAVDTVQDADNDGLSDSDESYWNTDFQNPDSDEDGFLDGEEAASGHDPTEPGPDDLLLDINLTSKVANLSVAGLVEGSLQPDSPEYIQSLSDLSFSIIDDGLRSLTPSDPSHITIVDSSKTNQQQYVYASEKIWEVFLTTFGKEIKDMENKFELTNDGGFENEEYVSYFKSQAVEFQNIADQLTEIKVPQNWEDDHISFYRLMSQMAIFNKAFADANNDSIKAAMALSLLSQIAENFPQLIGNYADKIKSEGLLGNDLFDLK